MRRLICALLFGFALVLPAVSPVWSAPIGSGTVTLDGTESLVGSVRVDRNGIASTWASPKPFPGTLPQSPTYFRTVSFTPGSLEDVEISYNLVSGVQAAPFVVAYLNSFDVNNLSHNYLGDPGMSPNTPGETYSFQVVVPTGNSLLLAFNNTSPIGSSPEVISYTVTGFPAVPLPSAMLLFGPGLAGLAVIRKRFKK